MASRQAGNCRIRKARGLMVNAEFFSKKWLMSHEWFRADAAQMGRMSGGPVVHVIMEKGEGKCSVRLVWVIGSAELPGKQTWYMPDDSRPQHLPTTILDDTSRSAREEKTSGRCRTHQRSGQHANAVEKHLKLPMQKDDCVHRYGSYSGVQLQPP
ncbi:hypothetical protein VOLCADRAFT_107004 [Volvox carteri f. nagariensis]|uniref:Uncharacterized protein n=1 Tax=Volvox carteri f. nagariensis TaxID=3068 RepID=D8UBK4_VOLCA|nr:uncharacterized protein VOLCADRAFT_107004 [Volvox carteri f. nagariensis]EFJ42959.1 hypothetical protein VOLCADRAFT_107004 [Volvox carteri f. nagariensis]|eukprot:XP_002955999.1 hypothetical protein VOLCADRAFT_107004 [Volvox carteri f. nagariensis]